MALLSASRFLPWQVGVALMLGFWPGSAALGDDLAVVAAIEAVYLTKFPSFVEWPPEPQGSTDRSAICVLGDDKIADEAALAESKSNAVTPVTVRRVVPAGVEGCQILFIGAGAGGQGAGSALHTVETSPTLTVTDRAIDGAKGVINFVIVNDRVRFEVDEGDAARHQLKISSKLLSIAVSVKPQ
jgi:hypothetical protein